MKAYYNENKFCNHLEEQMGVVLLAVMVAMFSVQVVMRYMLETSTARISKYSLYMFMYFVFLACSGTSLRNDHIQIMTVIDKFPEKIKGVTHLFLCVVNFPLVTVVGYYAFLRVADQFQMETVSTTQFPLWVMSTSLFIGMGASAIRRPMNIHFIIRYEFISGGKGEQMAGTILTGGLFTLVFVGFPITIALGPIRCLYSDLFGTIDIPLIVESFLSGTNSFTLLAIPFFILSEELMIEGGISQRLTNFCMSLVKDRPGGPAIVIIIASMFFAAISGSDPATVACIGDIMIPQIIRTEYSKEFSTAATATGGALGPITPPNTLFLLYGAATSISVIKLLLTRALPGTLLGIAMIIIIKKISVKERYVPGSEAKAELQKVYDMGFWYDFKEATWALLVPIIILGGVYSGIFSPTEASVVACVYVLFAGMFVYKGLKLTNLPGVFMRAAKSCSLTVIISSSTVSARLLTLEGVILFVADGVLDMTTSKYPILILVNVLLLVISMVVDAAPATIIFSSILLKIVQPLGMDPIQPGVVIVMNLSISMVTPPVRINLFIGCKIGKIQLEGTLKFTLQSLTHMPVVLALTTCIPAISLFFPQILT